MVMREILTAARVGMSVLIGAVFFVGAAGARDLQDNQSSKTLSLAPLSLGNPSAVHSGPRISLPKLPIDDVTIGVPKLVYQSFRAKNGDTLAALLKRAGAPSKQAHAAISALKPYFNPRKFRKGQVVRVAYRPEPAKTTEQAARIGMFKGFRLRPDLTSEINVAADDDGTFKPSVRERPLTASLVRAEGVIKSSLYVAGIRAGLTNSALAELIRAYSWDVDFQRDIRKNDHFQVMYEQLKDEDGNLVKSNRIDFATLTLSGKPVSIYRFKTADGHVNYYNQNGLSARKALMRTPIDGARLSSGFGRRKHPILGYTKKHSGVDFAAPRGTPIYAAGNGTISYAGNKGGYGRYIRIRHNATYATAYAHMKGFARGMRAGKRVNQGQVIGYVGTTGRSTGPHLHYEIIRNGRKTNPLRVKMPSGEKLKGNDLKRFVKERTRIDRQFAAIETGSTLLASTK